MNIINTYAPDMSYDGETHNKHWTETREIMNSILRNNVIFRRTDNNGQIAQGDENSERVGRWTMWNKTEGGNGRQLDNIRKEYGKIRSDTYFKPHEEKKMNWLRGTSIMGNEETE